MKKDNDDEFGIRKAIDTSYELGISSGYAKALQEVMDAVADHPDCLAKVIALAEQQFTSASERTTS